MHSKPLTRLLRLLTVVSPILILMGCSDGDGPERILATPVPPTTGVLVDAPVSGAAWETSGGDAGTTNDLGEFSYVPGDLVTFSVGGIVLGTAPGAPVISAVELTGSNNPNDQAAVNELVFLQSIDEDEDPDNGITISSSTSAAAASQTLDFNDPDFSTDVEAVVAAIAPGNTVVSESDALAHFYTTYSDLGGTDTFSFSFPGFPPVSGDVTYELVFADEFDEGSAPDPAFWNIETGYGPDNSGWGNNEWQLYTDSPDNLRVEDGNLVIQARCDTPPCGVRDDTITSARITTKDKVEFRYGTAIARIKPPVGDGAWPAFWALGANFPEVNWPRVGEIDFMEMHNAFSNDRTTHFTMHWCDETVNPSIGSDGLCFPQENGWTFFTQNRGFPESLGDDFHIFEADWDEDRIIGRIDGIPYFEKTIDPLTMEEFLREFFMILNVAMGGTLGSDNQPPNGNEVWPQTMLVDYVRVFQRTGQGQPAEDTLIDFENAPDTYTFLDFGGGAAAVIDNPASDNDNDSAQVGRMLKFAGEVFAGSQLVLNTPVPVGSGSVITIDVWSPRQVNVLFKIEGPSEAEIEMTHSGSGWETLSYDFGPFVGTAEGITLIFDLGVTGDADSDPDNWTFYFDNIFIPAAEDDDDDGPFGLISDFEGPPGVYDFGPELGFGGGVSEVIPNPVSETIDTSAQVVRMRKFGGEVFAGSLFTLPEPITIPAGTSFTMKVWSQRPVMVLFKLEPNLAELNLPHSGTGWEEMTFEFPGFAGTVEGLTFIFDLGILGDADNDPDNWTFYYDDIFAVAPDDSGPPPDPEAPVDFEGAPASYTFADFEGGVGDVIANPAVEGLNTSAQVGRMQKFMGADFAGSTLTLPAPVDVAAGDSFTMLVWSQRPVTVLFKLEGVGDNDAEVSVAHGGAGWEELTFPFPDYNGTVEGYTFIYDLGVVGDAMNDPVNWTFYFDDITLVPAGSGPGPMLSQIDLPITFDDPTVDYTVTDFGDPVAVTTTLVADPDDSGNTVASTTKPLGAPVWAGTTISTTAGLASAIPFSADMTTIGVRVWSPDAGIPVRLKADDMVGGSVSVETETMTTVAGQWETLIFNFANQVDGTPALDTGTSYTALSIFFNFGTDGDTAGEKTYLWDDVEFGVLEQIDLPITFDDALVDYTVTDFGDPVAVMTTLVADPDDAGNTVASTTKPLGAPVWAGTTLSTTAGLASPIPFSVGVNSVGVRVWSPDAGIPVRLKADDMVGGSVSVETEVMTTVAGQWEMLVFNFDEQVDGTPALDLGTTYTALSIFFNFGTDGDTAGEKTYLWDDVEFGVPLPDTTAPTLTVVSVTSDNALSGAFATTGNEVVVTLTADEPIVAPTVTIDGAAADSVTGDGAMWEARRVLPDTGQGAIGFEIGFADLAGNAGTAVTATTDGSSVTFDSVGSTLSIDGAPTIITSLDAFNVTFQFGEDVTGFELADIGVSNGTAGAFASTDAATYTADVTPDGNGEVTIDVAADAALDVAGNGSDAASVTVPIDMVSPGLTTVSIVSDNATSGGLSATTGDEVILTLTAEEPIVAPVVTIAGESVTATGGGTDWEARRTTLDTDAQGAIGFSIDFVDLVGNPGTTVSATTDGTSVVFDNVAPTVAIQGAPATFTTLDPIPLTVEFNEPVVDLTLSDIATTGGTASNLMGDGASYTVDVTPGGVGDVTVDIAAGAATDAAGNPSEAAAQVTITNDVTAPVLSFVGITTDGVTMGLQGYARAGDSVTLTITAPEDIDPPTVTIAGMSVTPTGAGTDWTATRVTDAGDDQGEVAFSIDFTTTGGVDGLTSTAVTDGSSVIFDSVAPTLTIDDTPTMVTTLDPISVTFNFTEDVTGFEVTDIVVTNGSAGGFASTDAATYTADITPDGNGDLTIDVAADAAIDVAANGSGAASVTVPIDMTAPELTIVSIVSDNVPSGGTAATTGDEVTVTLTADEPITQPTVMIAGVSVAATGAGTDWQASRIAEAGDDQGAIAFTIDFADLVGNPGTQVTATTDTSSVVFDNVAATLSIDDTPATITSLDPFTVTFQFGEDVTGFELADIDVTNGSADTFASSDAATYTADITPDGNGDVTIDVAADAANDIAGNGSDAASASITYTLPYWAEVWVDDFDGMMLDAANWTARTDGDCPDPCTGVQSYSPDRVSVAAGLLTIEARDDVVRGANPSSGLIDTRGNLEFQHGRVEIDVKLPAGTAGITPSLWMLPATDEYGPWPLSGEVDIINAPDGGGPLEHTSRYGLPEPEDTTATDTSAAPAAAATEFFTYALEWEGGEIRWFVDGVHVASQIQDNWYAYGEDADGVYTLGTGAAPFDQDFYLLLSLAVDTAGGTYPQSLQVEAVRVYECANAVDPAAGTGCAGLIDAVDPGIMPVVATPAPYNDAPYTESLAVYTDALATLDFIDEDSNVTSGMLVTETFGAGTVTLMTGTELNVDIDSTSGASGVRIVPGTFMNAVGSFDLTGGETAGEVLFRMRVNSGTGDPQLTLGLNSETGSGAQQLTYVADGTWRNYSVKIADLVADSVMQGTSLDIAGLTNLFRLETDGGTLNLDVDDISVKVACRDTGRCEATPRLTSTGTVLYSQDFEGLVQSDPAALSDDGWLIFGAVFDSGDNFLFQYGAFDAPNGGPGFSAIDTGQGGVDQGAQQVSIYNDYNCCMPSNGHFNGTDIVESLVFQQRTIVAGDVGTTLTFFFEAKAGNIDVSAGTTAEAFVKTLDPNAGFATTNNIVQDMTMVPASWGGYMLTLPNLDPALEGQILQFGFKTRASNFGASGIFYDNLQLIQTGP